MTDAILRDNCMLMDPQLIDGQIAKYIIEGKVYFYKQQGSQGGPDKKFAARPWGTLSHMYHFTTHIPNLMNGGFQWSNPAATQQKNGFYKESQNLRGSAKIAKFQGQTKCYLLYLLEIQLDENNFCHTTLVQDPLCHE